MTKICSIHHCELIHREGISKTTNKPYSFDSCPEKNADGSFCKAPTESKEADWLNDKPKKEDVDWDKIAEGKVRHGVVVAIIENGGLEALKGQLGKIDKVVKYIMTGALNEEN